MTFIQPDGSRREVEAPVGDSILDIAQNNGFAMEGACEGVMSCSTCHVIVAGEWFGRLPAASDDEEDMLDFAPGLTQTSRLGCQIVMAEELDGFSVTLPAETSSML